MEQEYVGIDLHRRRSVIVRMSPDGERLTTEKIDNNAMALAAAIARAGPNPKAVVEATYGWYWAADVLAECGAELHLAHPLGMKGITSSRRVKNDVKDDDRAVKASPTGGLRPTLTALPAQQGGGSHLEMAAGPPVDDGMGSDHRRRVRSMAGKGRKLMMVR